MLDIHTPDEKPPAKWKTYWMELCTSLHFIEWYKFDIYIFKKPLPQLSDQEDDSAESLWASLPISVKLLCFLLGKFSEQHYT